MSNPSSTASGTPFLDKLKPPIELALAQACDFGGGCPRRLGEAMRYAVLAPGKRLRPILVLMAAEACVSVLSGEEGTASELETRTQAAWQTAMPGAVAVEMIHAYSLIHDDLPAMDDDDLRRGRPTVHIEFDEATAILAGDALQAEAFAHLVLNIADPQRAADAVRILSIAAGASRLVGGQSDDLMSEADLSGGRKRTVRGDDTVALDDPESLLTQLESIHRRKTGALFSASLELGATLVGADEDSKDALRRYASHLGLAFQVVDDYLDFTADTQTLGKRTGKDAGRGKLTYPGLLGVEAAKQKAAGLIESAKQEALFFEAGSTRLVALADYVLERTH